MIKFKGFVTPISYKMKSIIEDNLQGILTGLEKQGFEKVSIVAIDETEMPRALTIACLAFRNGGDEMIQVRICDS